jgi:UDP-glucose 4-epimerase
MKILITGANGFIGRNLKEYFQVRYGDIYYPRRQELNLLDSQAVYEYLTKNEFDIVIHCAITLTSVEQNLKMFFNLERCSQSFGKMFCVGSGAEYDKDKYIPKMKEEYFGKHIPSDIYGFSKYVIAKDIESKYRNIYNLRVFGSYGKYEDYKRRFISNNICRVLSGLNISIKKNVYFDYLYIDDFSRIVEMFINKDAVKRSYNICTGKTIDLLTLAKIVRQIDGRDMLIDIKEDGLGVEYSGDNTLFLREFGEFDFTQPEKAISQLYYWYKDKSGLVFNAKYFV